MPSPVRMTVRVNPCGRHARNFLPPIFWVAAHICAADWCNRPVRISTAEADGRSFVAVEGDCDVHTSGALREAVKNAQAATGDVVIDLAGVDFMDSTGLGVLVGALTRSREAGTTLELARPGERVLRLLQLTGLDQQFTVTT